MRISLARSGIAGPLAAGWLDRGDAAIVAACVLGPLVLSGWLGGPAPAIDPASVVARIGAGLAVRRLLTRLGAEGRAAMIGAALFAACGLRLHAAAGAGFVLMVWAVVRERDRDVAAPLLAGVGAALEVACDPGASPAVMVVPALWAVWRITMVPSGWDGAAALRLFGGAAFGVVIAGAFASAWLPGAADADGYAPASQVWMAAAAVGAGAASLWTRAPARALRLLLLAWSTLCLGRALGIPVAAFVLDIPVTRPDRFYVDAAVPGLALASAIAGALAAGATVGRSRLLALGGAGFALALIAAGARAPAAGAYVADGDDARVEALALAPGAAITGFLPAGVLRGGAVSRVGVEVGTYRGQADGALEVLLCGAGRCASGTVRLDRAPDNAVLFATLDPSLATREGDAGGWRVTHVGGTAPVAIWLAPATADRALRGPDGTIAGMSAHVVLFYEREDRVPTAAAP